MAHAANAAANAAKLRSSTGQHTLLPAANSSGQRVLIPLVPQRTFAAWAFGRGTVLRRIWPAVLAHTIFAAIVVTVSLLTDIYLGIPSVMLTVLGVVIGFVLAYRVSTGYDRYWAGRCAWTDMIRTSRTMSRLIWFHVPVRFSPRTQQEQQKGTTERSVDEMEHVMKEKRLALELIEGFMIASKHHLRGEMGIYYEDLYPLVRPLHNHPSTKKTRTSTHTNLHPDSAHKAPVQNGSTPSSSQPSPSVGSTQIPGLTPSADASSSTAQLLPNAGTSSTPVTIPPIQTYGTFKQPPEHRTIAHMSSSSSLSSLNGRQHVPEHPLLPSNRKTHGGHEGVFGAVSTDLIPLHPVFSTVWDVVTFKWLRKRNDYVVIEEGGHSAQEGESGTHAKHRPRIAGGGQNLPVLILSSLSEWFLVLEERNTVGGNALGGLYGCIMQLEASLAVMEMILTTPLPFVYSAHIRHTVWLYLFMMPFQLVDQFGWHAIPGTALAAFFYLGFIAAGEEIEQPFGYDFNDLDLDVFCREIVHVDLEQLKKTPCSNVYLGQHKHLNGGKDTVVVVEEITDRKDAQPNEVFGTIE